MRSLIPGIRAAAYSALWAMKEEKLHAVLDFIDLRAQGITLSREQRRERGIQAQAGRSAIRTVGQIAILPVRGVIAHHAGMEMDISGGTSTVALGRAFAEAVNTPDVAAIVFDCDSPGGTIEGVPELAAQIFAARGKKPLIASVNAHCHSAAYWLASQCDEICITPSGTAGDIGVMTIRTDISAAENKAGVTRTLIKAGKYKGEGNPSLPATEAELDARADMVNEIYGLFAQDVARGRNVSVATVEDGMGEGRSLSASQCVATKLADRIESLDQTIARLGGRQVTGSRRSLAAQSQTIDARLRAEGEGFDVVECPECGAPMDMQDGEQVCPECGYTAPATDETSAAGTLPIAARAERTVIAASATASPAPAAEVEHIPIVAGATPPGSTTPPTTQPTISQESPVPEPTTPTLAELQAQARVEAAKRASNITALCEAHDIPSAAMHAYLGGDLSVEAIGLEIAKQKREARAADPSINVGTVRETQKPWETMGHFAAAVQDFYTPGNKVVDPRLFAAAQGVQQMVPTEGGLTVPPQFSTKIWDEASGDVDDLLGMTDSYTIEGESLTFNANAETSRATGSRFGAVQGYWINEADQITKSKPKFRALRLEPQELAVLIYATDKSLRNSPVALGSYLGKAAQEEIKFLSGNAIFAGTGAGQPLGIMNSSSLITVSKETSQATLTLQQENISKMWARLHPRARAGAVWLINADVEPALDTLNSVVKNVAATENVGGYANKVFDAEKRTLKGRPIITTEYSSSFTALGDIVLVNLGWYATGVRGAGVRADVSMHLRFDYAESAFRFMYELDGQPWLASAITPFKGSNTQSWAVTLQAR